MKKDDLLLYCGTIWGIVAFKAMMAMALAQPLEAFQNTLLVVLVGIVWKSVRDHYPDVK